MRKGPLIVRSVLATLATLLVLGLVFVVSGAYDVAADAPHAGLTRLVLSTLSDRSVETRASSVVGAPPTDPEAVSHGFGEYDEMCVTCHGAPGVEPSSVGKGLNPEPPDLAAPDAETDAAELFWVVDHGIKFTGMPGFGRTHSTETVWAIVAFLEQLPGMTPEQYAQWRAEHGEHAEAEGPEAEHAHGAEQGEEHEPGAGR